MPIINVLTQFQICILLTYFVILELNPVNVSPVGSVLSLVNRGRWRDTAKSQQEQRFFLPG